MLGDNFCFFFILMIIVLLICYSFFENLLCCAMFFVFFFLGGRVSFLPFVCRCRPGSFSVKLSTCLRIFIFSIVMKTQTHGLNGWKL